MLSTIGTLITGLSVPSIVVGLVGYFAVTKGVPSVVHYGQRVWGWIIGAETTLKADVAALKADVAAIKAKVGL